MSDRIFKDDVELDKFDLDTESAKQSSIYLHWSQELAKSRRKRDQAKLDLKVRRAELATSYRATSDKKPTNDQVTDYLDSHKEVVTLERELLAADFDYNELEGACTALEQKKSMLELLTKLQLNNYFSRPDGYSKGQAVSESFRTGLGSGRNPRT